MSRYYRKNNYKKNKKFTNSKFYKIASKVCIVLLILAIVGALASMLDFKWLDNIVKKDEAPNYVDVHIVPGDNWAADGSSYGVWCWNDSGVPAAAFVLASDEDGDGVHTVRVSNEYSNILFVDLVPGATELGASWVNKREQTNNLLVPTDENIYYHIYASEWANTSELMFAPTIEEITVYIDADAWDVTVNKPIAYYFDKTGVNEPSFVEMTQCGAHQFLVTIPAGYTHVIFIEYSDNTYMGSWDEIVYQTVDLIIPTGDANHFNTESNQWEVPSVE